MRVLNKTNLIKLTDRDAHAAGPPAALIPNSLGGLECTRSGGPLGFD